MTGGFLSLLDDLASITDDLATLSKVAVKNAAGVAGDDLAVGAEQVSGLDPTRELPIVWAVAKGSLLNKCVLVPAVLLLDAVLPAAVTPLMMAGGAYLCYEGIEKVLERLHPAERAARRETVAAAARKGAVDLMELERGSISEAVRTDAVLSAEIVVIAHDALSSAAPAVKAAALSVAAVVMTAGIYGLVALIVKADDVGLHLARRSGRGAWADARRRLGRGLLAGVPHFMKGLTVVGTAAMFMVGGGILVHGFGAGHGVHGPAALGMNLAAGVAAGLAAVPLAALARRAAGARGLLDG